MVSGEQLIAATRGADTALPRQAGRYELLHEIARGGMAAVYLGRSRGAAGFERFVAIKYCHRHLSREDEFAAMFLDEARLAAKIHHANVVGTLDVGEDDSGALYLVMELVDGYSLAQLVRTCQARELTVPVPVALRVMVDALDGLHAAHQLCDAAGDPLDLVHRDVSPQNVLVGVDGVARITDFGIAKASQRLAFTRDGHLKGKLSYMAPEQISRQSSVTRQADVYAAGVVLWELLAGRRLFDGKSDVETLNLVLRGVPAPLSEVVPDIAPELEAAVLRALERMPEDRFATAEAFAEAIEGCGAPIARAREVGAFVQAALADTLVRRRELFRHFAASRSPSIVRQLVHRRSVAPPPPLRSERPADVPTRRAAIRSRGRRPVGVVVVLLLALVALALSALHHQTSAHARRALAPPPVCPRS